MVLLLATQRHDVSIHARAWRATYWLAAAALTACVFQFTPARGGRPDAARHGNAEPRCFNSRPRVAGDWVGEAVKCFIKVSIHARAWRATAGRGGSGGASEVSIHTRAWRATSAAAER